MLAEDALGAESATITRGEELSSKLQIYFESHLCYDYLKLL